MHPMFASITQRRIGPQFVNIAGIMKNCFSWVNKRIVSLSRRNNLTCYSGVFSVSLSSNPTQDYIHFIRLNQSYFLIIIVFSCLGTKPSLVTGFFFKFIQINYNHITFVFCLPVSDRIFTIGLCVEFLHSERGGCRRNNFFVIVVFF